MLNRYKLMREIESLSDKLFVDFSEERNIAQKVWERISSDATFKYKVRSISTPWTIPSWQGNLGDVFEVEKKLMIISLYLLMVLKYILINIKELLVI